MPQNNGASLTTTLASRWWDFELTKQSAYFTIMDGDLRDILVLFVTINHYIYKKPYLFLINGDVAVVVIIVVKSRQRSWLNSWLNSVDHAM